jgi:predicted Zn-dependent protease
MFERAHKLDPRHTVPLWNLWDLELNRLDHPARAEQHARTLAQLQPDNPYIRHLVAWTAVALRRFDEAERITKEVLAAVPLHPFAFPNYGHLLLHRGAAREAADVYAQILEKIRAGQLDQSASDAALFLGIALSTDGRTAEARDVYEKQIAFLEAARVKMPSIYEQARLATLYAAAGHRAEAERVASDMLQRGQKNPWILYTLARTRALLGELEPAADLLRRARAAGYDQPYFVLIDPPLRALQNHPVIGELAVLP